MSKAGIEKNHEHIAVVVMSRNNHIITAQPIIEELRKRDWEVVVLRFEEVWERIESIARNIKKHLKRNHKKISSELLKENPPLKEKAYGLISKLIYGMATVFRTKKPSVIIVMTDGPLPESLAILTGRLMGAPSLLLQVGAIGHGYKCSRFLVDKIAVMGPFSRDIYAKCGVDATKLVVTGRPAYDILARADEFFDRVKSCDKLGLNPKKKIIVWTTQTHGLSREENKKNISAVCNAMMSLKDIQLAIKLHPSENQRAPLYRRMNFLKPLIFGKDADTSELLYVSDLVLTKHSTTAIEAMILDKPVITMNFSKEPDPMPYAESGAAIGVYKERDLASAMRKALYDEKTRKRLAKAREEFIYEHSYKRDGKATERVIRLIEQISKKG